MRRVISGILRGGKDTAIVALSYTKSITSNLALRLGHLGQSLMSPLLTGFASPSLKILTLFFLGNAMIDYSVWKIGNHTPFRWIAGILVGLQLLQLAAGIEDRSYRGKR